MKICSIGGITQDIFLWYQAEKKAGNSQSSNCLSIPFGEKIDLERVAYFLGGGAANTAINFAGLGHEAGLIAAYGNDATGAFITHELKKHQLDLSGLIQCPNEPSGTSYILYNQCHDRIIFVHRGANSAILQSDFPLHELAKYEVVYITSMKQNEAIFSSIIAEAKKQHLFIAINPGSTQLSTGAEELCKALDAISIVILNTSEAATLFATLTSKQKTSTLSLQKTTSQPQNKFDLPLDNLKPERRLTHFFSLLLSMGPEIIIVTDGACGVYVATQKELWHHQALTVPVIDTVGAGDAFGSTFVAVYAHTKNIPHALKAGMYQSSSIIQQLGATNGLLSKEKLHHAIATIPDALISHTTWDYQHPESIDQ